MESNNFPKWFSEQIQEVAKSFYVTNKAEAVRYLYGISLDNNTLNNFGMKEILEWFENNFK